MWVQLVTPNTNKPYRGGWCLEAVQRWYGSLHWFATALKQWDAEPNKHWDLPPEGIDVPIYFTIDGEPAGHIAIRLANGKVASASYAGTHQSAAIHNGIDGLIKDYASGGVTLKYAGWGEHCANLKVVEWRQGNMLTENQAAVLYRLYLGSGITEYGYKHRIGKQTFDEAWNDLINSGQHKAIIKNAQDNKVIPVKNLPEGVRKVFNQ